MVIRPVTDLVGLEHFPQDLLDTFNVDIRWHPESGFINDATNTRHRQLDVLSGVVSALQAVLEGSKMIVYRSESLLRCFLLLWIDETASSKQHLVLKFCSELLSQATVRESFRRLSFAHMIGVLNPIRGTSFSLVPFENGRHYFPPRRMG
jgi:hypothetical protein